MWQFERITSGGNEVVLHTTFISFDDSPSELFINHGDAKSVIVIQFVDDPAITDAVTDVVAHGPGRLLITFKNFNSPFGIANVAPIKIGEFSGGTTYMQIGRAHV